MTKREVERLEDLNTSILSNTSGSINIKGRCKHHLGIVNGSCITCSETVDVLYLERK